MTGFFPMFIRKQIVLMTLLVALPAFVVIIYSGYEQRNEDIDEAHKDIQQLANLIASEQKNLVAGTQQLVGALAQLPEVKGHDPAGIDQFLADILKMNPQYLNIFIADLAGTMWASAAPMKTAFSILDRRYFYNAVATGQFSSGEYMIGRIFGRPTISFGYPYRNKRGEVAGVIAVTFNLDYIRKTLEQSRLLKGSSYLIIDRNGVILGRGINPEELVGKSVKPEFLRQMREGPDGGVSTGTGVDGSERFSSYRKLYLAGDKLPYMYIRTGIPVKEIVAKANRSLFLNLALLSPFIIVAFILAWFIGKRSIVDRIKVLEQASRQLATGDLDIRVSDLVTGGELGRLAQTFDTMAHQLTLRDRELRESKEFLTTIIETEPECVKLLAPDGSILMMNRAGLDMIQVESFDQIKGKSPYPLIVPEYLDAFKALIEDVFNGKTGNLEFQIVGVKGRPLWLETHAVPLRNDTGEIVSLLGITSNITERKEMDRMKDEIISAVSHEMRTPLTAMLGYIEFIMEHEIDEVQTGEYLGIVYREAERLKELISNFLDMQRLRAKRGVHNFRPLALGPLLEEAATLFANASNKHRITVDAITGLPTVFGNEEDLRSVLNNLISNAVKYSPKGGNIVLGTRRENRIVTFWVRDEGMGITPEEQEKIFDRFYRIDNTACRTTSGTGLGLALVKEIAIAHGGRVWVESEVGKGSTFYVSLPVV